MIKCKQTVWAAGEDCVTPSKAPELLLHGPGAEIVLSASAVMIKNGFRKVLKIHI